MLRGRGPARRIAAAVAPDIVEFCRAAGLTNQKIPEQLEIVAELPRNASGKVLKYQLQAQLG